MHLRNWTARRAGGRITIVGIDIETGRENKIVGVDKIMPSYAGAGYVNAHDKNGDIHELRT